MKKMMFVAMIAILSLIVSACGGKATSSEGDGEKRPIIIGSKDFTENALLGELYAQVIEAQGVEVERKVNLGGTVIVDSAIRSGEIDLYPEYTGTGLLAILKKPLEKDQAKVLETVRSGYKEAGIEWLEPSPLNNTFAFVTTKKEINKLTDLNTQSKDLVLAFPQEFDVRDDGLPGLQKYFADKGGFKFKKQFQIDASIRFQPLLEGKADVSVVYGTDGQIAGYDLKLVEDDIGFFPVYNVAPIVRTDVLKMYPEIEEALNKLSMLLTDDVMQGLNWEVDGPDKKDYAEVAKAFLQENGLIK